MYMKCGSLNEGSLVCEKLDVKNLISQDPMIAGCGMHSLGKDAGRYFYGMVETGFKPDKVTFVAVLSACSRAGLVVKGRKIYDQMTEECAIEPRMEHYACVVNLLSRSGSLQEAREIAKPMPLTPNACVLGALLNACRVYKLPVLWRQQPPTFSARIRKLWQAICFSLSLLLQMAGEMILQVRGFLPSRRV
ncbi:putative pentatricopeptide repeat-containing protein At1g17630 [Rhodamnia argentea]|uniref:Pentatricopeptide repeat-containing protein At1g17630 n=1 Tax=Rhodamnia argentea TaxID=178133 RepID=A0ABM3HTJ0_9MYRT|nr:putative pentatricopeptide repeat-containing protein At1g17630 [Rhodamnia argentea]